MNFVLLEEAENEKTVDLLKTVLTVACLENRAPPDKHYQDELMGC